MTKLIYRRLCCCDNLRCFPRILSIEPRAARVFVGIVSTLMGLFIALVVIFFTGSELEGRRVKQLPNTNNFYKTSNVCALILPPLYEDIFYNQSFMLKNLTINNKTSISLLEKAINQTRPKSAARRFPPIVDKTYLSPDEFKNRTDALLAHCGSCGACSNPHDIAIYDATRNTLQATTKGCAKHGLVGGRRAANKCMESKVGLTPGCNQCWVENISCDLRECLFSCLWHNSISTMFRRGGAQNDTKPLNACTLCDEKRCGPAFIKCAGANRRRSGIISDISRSKAQVCHLPQPKWWQSPLLQAYYAGTQPAPSPGVYKWSFLRG